MTFQRFYRGCIIYLGLLSVTMHHLFIFYFSRVYLLNGLRYLKIFSVTETSVFLDSTNKRDCVSMYPMKIYG